MAHEIPMTGTCQQFATRMKSPVVTNGNHTATSSSSSPPVPYYHHHHLFDRNNNVTNVTNSLLFNPVTTFGENGLNSLTHTSAKRPRSNNNNNSPNSSSNSFLLPFVGSPPSFEPDRPLPDLNTNWSFTNRNVSRNTTTWMSNAHNFGHTNIAHNSTTSGFADTGLPNGTAISIDSLLPDYDSTLYSLWNTPGNNNVSGYETEALTAQGQQQQVQPPLYMTSDDELKMDYPQLGEFHQDLDLYLNDTMESGGPSPTTPLGTSTANNVVKTEHLMHTDKKIGSRESQLEMLLVSANTTEYSVKQDRVTGGLENGPGRSTKRLRDGYNNAYAATPVVSGSMAEAVSSENASSSRTLSRSATMEQKQRGAVVPSSVSSHSELMLKSSTKSQMGGIASGVVSSTIAGTSKPTASDTLNTKTGKRPRSRQCEFPGCQNRARSHQKCKKHGGAHQCVFEGCTKNSQSRGLCIAHGGGSRCKKEGCARAAQSKGLCKSHGGGEFCAVEGCNKKAHLKHLCRTHGGGVRCKFENCSKWAQRKGWCMAHAKEFAASR